MQDSIDRTKAQPAILETYAPARLDRLPWGRFHTLVVIALGITWVLDGLEVTLAGSVAGALKASPVLHFTDSEVGTRVELLPCRSRQRLARVRLARGSSRPAAPVLRHAVAISLVGSRDRVFLGSRELLPVPLSDRRRHRRRVQRRKFHHSGDDPGAIPWLDGPRARRHVLDRWRAWSGELRSCFSTLQTSIPRSAGGSGSLSARFSASAFSFLRSFLPESPRWLAIHGREEEAEKVVSDIEAGFRKHGAKLQDVSELKPMRVHPRTHTPLKEVFKTIFVTYRTRALVALTLMATQAFFYNAIFFTYALVLTKFYNVPVHDVGWYILPFALANVLGPLILGPLFDSVGRKTMIAFTYAISGVLLAISGWLFVQDQLSATHQTIAWALIFFFASPAAGSAYLTVSEVFPVEIRALAIAIFYALGTAIGGAGAPYLLGSLIETGERMSVFQGYLLGAGLMIFAAIVQAIWGVAAERKPLEAVARPLSSAAE